MAARSEAERAAREAIVAACRAMNAKDFNQGAAGNVSARFGPSMLITPSGVDYDDLTPDMIVAMDLSAESPDRDEKTGLKASSEWRFHRDILRARADVGAVVHAHAPYATVLSMLRRPIPASHYMIAAFGGAQIECTDYAPFGTAELSALALAGLGPRNGVILGSHGMIAVGPDLKRALWLAGELETLARLHYLASLAGAPVVLPENEVLSLVERFAAYGPGAKKG
ncbi:class II aldolase/adducin family protein [Rhodoblastus acidophilus]|uniref:Class II aldolase/adducin family protein n=1 Tax=Candidatus Rhodoblastus alkanivorans TaxID=2954117 RepID=A0ABS9ZAP3_9HYPH|nr:class II aldolase/adducin family protein [Candidatus Rhodoblastus alkanivorans]MCI4677824.1 class II aldolase/adducin family protein [Candidatus Rhodoblastus alkanivorans]MCI4684678.1 class II aldolase/adducin family protein [Candidatus Rhodoblastus alkanivorans]MDI4642000.1 class II aldolase/adducin family protein [Rhodoblastus acidophilus]